MTSTLIQLEIQDEDISGELALLIAPGTTADVQTRAIDDALQEPLSAHARELGLVLSAQPSRFVRAVPGKDAEGRLRFAIRGRTEGDRLVPAHGSNKRKKH